MTKSEAVKLLSRLNTRIGKVEERLEVLEKMAKKKNHPKPPKEIEDTSRDEDDNIEDSPEDDTTEDDNEDWP